MTSPIGEEWKDLDTVSRVLAEENHADEIHAAQKRIQQIRCGGLELRLLDHRGQALRELEVSVQQTRSSFPWGDQLWGLDTLLRHGFEQSDRVRHFTRLFTGCLNSANCLTYWTEAPRNDGPKHMEFQGEDKLDNFETQVNWALRNGLTPKGHPIFWSIPKAYPEWLRRYPIETQWKFIEVRVRNLVARFKGKVKMWDVVNEAMWEAAPKHLPTRYWPHIESLDTVCEYIIPVLRWAREEDPDAKFIVNDYGMEKDKTGQQLLDREGNPVTAGSQRARYTALFRRLREEGASPDAMGIQAHTGDWLRASELNSVLDELATGGVPIHFTEFWARNQHLIDAGMDPEEAEEIKADYIARVMTLAFAHPSVEAFYFWGDVSASFGFAADHNSLGMPSSSNRPTVVYTRIQQLLREEWMTRQILRTDKDGCVRMQGFFGDYRVQAVTSSGMPVGCRFQHLPGKPGLQTLTFTAL